MDSVYSGVDSSAGLEWKTMAITASNLASHSRRLPDHGSDENISLPLFVMMTVVAQGRDIVWLRGVV